MKRHLKLLTTLLIAVILTTMLPADLAMAKSPTYETQVFARTGAKKNKKKFSYKEENFRFTIASLRYYEVNSEDKIVKLDMSNRLDATATYYLDGKKQNGTLVHDKKIDQFDWDELLAPGKHTLKIKKKGYKNYKITFTINESKDIIPNSISRTGIWKNEDGSFTLPLSMNPNIILNKISISLLLDGQPISLPVKESFINGDGLSVFWFDAGKIPHGEHTLTVSAEGYESATVSFSNPY